MQAGLSRTSGTFENLTRTTAKTAAKQFENALDRAYMQVTTGAFSTDAAIRQAVKDLSAQGVASIRYPSGRVDTLETAVRRAVVTGVNQTAIQAALERAKELGAELMELKAHQGARPSHAAWQGKIVRVAGEPEAGESYLSLSDIGYGTGAGFGGWNCHHSWSPYWPGTARTWTDEQLEALKEPSVTYDGKPMTDYEASQQQCCFERQQRRWKREYKAMEAAGQDTYEAATKIREWQEKEKDFLRQTGRKADADRATVAQFSWHDGKKVAQIPALARKIDRRTQNTGAFSGLEVTMQKREVLKIARKYGVDMTGITVKITRSEAMLAMPLAGSADPKNIGRIDLFPNSFANEEQLVRTLIHEKCHVKQFTKYGGEFVQENREEMEKVAYRFEDLWYTVQKSRMGGTK